MYLRVVWSASTARALVMLLLLSTTQACGTRDVALLRAPTAPPLAPTSTASQRSPIPVASQPPATPSPWEQPPFDRLLVAYAVQDDLWIWKNGVGTRVYQRVGVADPLAGVWHPRVSPNGVWIAFEEYEPALDQLGPIRTLRLVSTDGSRSYPLIEPQDLSLLFAQDTSPLLDEFEWASEGLLLLFNTHHLLLGPPGSWPNFDLFSVDLSGQILQLAAPGEGGRFFPSPDGRFAALATTTEIGVLDLTTLERRALLKFDPFLMGCECLRIPEVTWSPDSASFLVSIPPADLLYPDQYGGEPEQIWRLTVEGSTALIAEVQPLGDQFATQSFSPDGTKLAYLRSPSDLCEDLPALHIRDISTSSDQGPLHCITQPPEWTPDSSHYIFSRGYGWELGNAYDTSTEPLDFLSTPHDPSYHSRPEITWIDDAYFLLTLSSRTACTLTIATLDGVVTTIVRTEQGSCPDATYGLAH
jgi:hypothetical protein